MNLFIEKFQSIGIIPNISTYHHYQVLKFRLESIPKEVEESYLECIDFYKNKYVDIKSEQLNDYNKIVSSHLEDYYFQFVSKHLYYIVSFKHL